MTVPHAVFVAGAALAFLAGCGSGSAPSALPSSSAHSSAKPEPGSPGGSAARATPCVDKTMAAAIWKQVNDKLNAVVLDPQHRGVSDATAGVATEKLNQYIKDELASKNLTEREKDRLDSLGILTPGCGKPVAIQTKETLVQDDYVRPNGQVDHADEQVGQQNTFIRTYERFGDTWKMTDFDDLTAPPPTTPPQVI